MLTIPKSGDKGQTGSFEAPPGGEAPSRPDRQGPILRRRQRRQGSNHLFNDDLVQTRQRVADDSVANPFRVVRRCPRQDSSDPNLVANLAQTVGVGVLRAPTTMMTSATWHNSRTAACRFRVAKQMSRTSGPTTSLKRPTRAAMTPHVSSTLNVFLRVVAWGVDRDGQLLDIVFVFDKVHPPSTSERPLRLQMPVMADETSTRPLAMPSGCAPW
jgi:hypothetical protein